MSKWAIEGLTKAMAEELPAGMAAVPLNPGSLIPTCSAHAGRRARLLSESGTVAKTRRRLSSSSAQRITENREHRRVRGLRPVLPSAAGRIGDATR
jgi:NAD(P)-dependent dehydrogenase (short-subunit alcohol dehydrogenase family)